MDKELISKLKEQINKSGFPLELDVSQILSDFQYTVFKNVYFCDSDKKTHEIDAVVMFDGYGNIGNKEYTIKTDLIVECKSSCDKPWVFFSEESQFKLMGNYRYISYISNQENDQIMEGAAWTELAEHHYNDVNIPESRTYFEAFGHDAGSNIYKAITNITHSHNFYRSYIKRKSLLLANQEKFVIYLFPCVIILRGKLFIAEKIFNDFNIEEVQHILLKTPNIDVLTEDSLSVSSEVIIDVIQESYLLEYMATLRRDSKNTALHLKKQKQENTFNYECSVDDVAEDLSKIDIINE